MPWDVDATPELVTRLARLAGLEMSQARAAELAPQVQAIREDIAALGKIDLTDVEPLVFPARQERAGGR